MPHTNNILELGHLAIPQLILGPEMSDPELGKISLLLENLEYEYVEGRGYEFYDYYKKAEEDITIIAEATIHGAVHVSGPLWVPMIFNLKWAYGIDALVKIWSPKLPAPEGPVFEPPPAPPGVA